MTVSNTVSELHTLVRTQVRGDSARSTDASAAELSTSQRAAVAAFRRRVQRSRGRSVVTPTGEDVWGLT
jgi:hypothetical protein